MSVLALIPERGGSKGIPRKNILPIGGLPLISWSIRAGLEAGSVDRVVVSTDDEEIAAVAAAAGAEVPFQRPAELAGDLVADLPVFRHALDWLAEHQDYRPELVVHLRPTSPARRAGLIDDAVAMLRGDPSASSVRSVRPADHSPHKLWWITDDHLTPVLGTMEAELFNEPRQALPQAWIHDGVIDVIRTEILLGGSMTGPRILALPLTFEESADIDRVEDIAAAEVALARLAQGRGIDDGV